MSDQLAGSPGPHIFVESLDALVVADEDMAHLVKSLRMRDGDPLTASDGNGRWRPAAFSTTGVLQPVGDAIVVADADEPTTVAFSLTKSSKPEWVIQKLTELGIAHIVVLQSERTIVRWDDAKVAKATTRWNRIIREAAMQSHRVRLPTLQAVVRAAEWLSQPGVAAAHFDGAQIGSCRSVAIGPEGGWTDDEIVVAASTVSLGETVLRAETAAIAAGVLLTTNVR